MSIHRREFLAASSLALFSRSVSAIPLSEIKLGVTTDEIDEDVLTAAKFLNRFGLKWAEIRQVWGKYNTVQPVEKIREAKSILGEHGIRVSIEGTPFFKVPLPADDKRLDAEWAVLDAAMERAKVFGTDKLRTFAFTLKGNETPDANAYGRIYELVRESARRAAKHGLRLAVENVGGSYVWTGEEAGRLLKHVKEDNLGLTWDPNNAAQKGETPFPDGYRHLDPKRIFHVHLRDFRNENGKVEWAPVGGGEAKNVEQIRALRRDGYQGTYTLETHWRSPAGKAAASETSLKGLLDVIRRV